MDIGSAFTFVFDDQDWIKKLAIGGLIVLAGIITIPILVGFAILLLVSGYMIEVLKNVRDQNPTPLPEWTDFGALLKTGFFVFVIGLVYYIPVYVFACAGGLVQFLPEMTQMDTDVADMMIIVTMCLNCVQFIISFLAGFVLPAGLIRYAQTDSLGAAFQFGEIFSFIRTNIGDYIIAVLLSWVASLIGMFGLILCVVGVFFTGFWSVLVSAHLYGQLARKA